jgi:hypothetical protein
MYDIYLSVGSDKLAFAKASPGFLGLRVMRDVAAEQLEQLVLAGGYGYVVPVAYHQPKVTAQMAMPIAREAIAQKQKKYFPSYSFKPVQFWREGAMWWEFGTASEELGKSRHIPGCVSVRVDKLDGHLWTAQEQVSLHAHGEEYYLQSATSLKLEQIVNLLASKLGLEGRVDYRHQNRSCLKGPALVVSAFKHSYPAAIEKMFGLWPTTHICFRTIPYKTGYETAPLLMLRALMKVLRHDCKDAVLTFDDGGLATLLTQTEGQLVLGEKWSSWASSRAVPSTLYELMRLDKSAQGKERWQGEASFDTLSQRVPEEWQRWQW